MLSFSDFFSKENYFNEKTNLFLDYSVCMGVYVGEYECVCV